MGSPRCRVINPRVTIFSIILVFNLVVAALFTFSATRADNPITPSGNYSIEVERVWINGYNGDGNGLDQATAIDIDSEGNVYVTGFSRGPPGETQPGTYGIITIKYNKLGVVQWVQRWDNLLHHLDDFASSIAVDALGNVYVTGKSLVGDRDYNIVTIKYSTLGEKLWEDHYYGGFSLALDYPEKVILDEIGNVYVVGTANGENSQLDICTIKYTVNGKRLWVRLYNGEANGNDTARDIAINDGCVVVVGETWTHHNWSDYVTIKYTEQGELLWVRTYDCASLNDGAYGVVIDEFGNIYVTGSSNSEIAYLTYDYATIKYSPNGDTLWVKRYDGNPNDPDWLWIDFVSDIVLNTDGTIVVTGKSTKWCGQESFPTYYATVCYQADGDVLWENKHYVYRGDPPSLALDNRGNIYLCGSKAGGPTYHDFLTIGFSASGSVLWVEEYNGPGNHWDKGADIAVDDQGNVYVTGFSTGIGTDYDYTTIKYSQIRLPYIPNTPHPGDGSIQVPLAATISWLGGHPDNHQNVTYDIYFGETNPPQKRISNHTSTVYNPGVLSHDTTYYWSIISWDESNRSTRGPLWSFTTASRDITPPRLTITIPKEGYLYIAGTQIMRRGIPKTLLIGEITITVDIPDTETEIHVVEFYINGIKQCSISNAPYTYLWNQRFFFLRPQTIRVVAYDIGGNCHSKELQVYKIF